MTARRSVIWNCRAHSCATWVTDAQGALIPSMSRKWKQINKFIEVFDHALASAPVAAAGAAGGRLRLGQGLPDLRHARLPAQQRAATHR
jgi:hypothetical protein